MNLFCPKIDSDDFKEMLQAFSGEQEDYIYYLWNANNGNPLYLDHKGEPSLLFEDLLSYTEGDRLQAMRLKSTVFNYTFRDVFGDWLTKEYTPNDNNVYDNGEPQMDNILDIEMMDQRKPGHMDPRVQAAIDKYGEDLITDTNNPNTWDIEVALGLLDKEQPFVKVEGQQFKRKQLQGFSDAKAKELMEKVRELGGYAYPVDVRTPSGKIKTGIGVGYKIGRPSTQAADKKKKKTEIELAGQRFTIKEADSFPLRKLLRKIETYNASGTYIGEMLLADFSSYFNANPEVKASLNLLLNNRSKNRNIKVEVGDRSRTPGQEDSYMDYDPNTHTITLYSQPIVTDPTLDGFLNSYVHELFHAFTSHTLHFPETEIDKQFATTMKEIVADLRKHKNISNKYAMTDEHEFVAVFKTDPSFAASLKMYSAPGSKKNFLERFIDAVVTLVYRYTGYKLRKDKGENLHDYVQNAISTFVNNKSVYWSPSKYKQNKIYQTAIGEINEKYEDIKKTIDPTKPETFVNAFTNLAKFLKEEKLNKVAYRGVTRFMAEAGYGITEADKAKMTPTSIENMERSANIGKAIHRTVEGNSKDIAFDILKETGFSVSDDSVDMIATIIKDIKKSKTPRGGSIIALSEVTIIDPDTKLHGVIDFMIIDNLGRIHIFDFKTKEGSGWQWYDSNKFGASSRTKDHLQLGIYKHMLEKFLNMPVSSMNIVMLKPTVTDGVIGSVLLDTTHSQTGVDTFTKEEATVRKVLGESAKRFHWSSAQSQMTADADYMKTMEYKLAAMESNKVTELDKIYNDTVKILDDKLEIMRKRYAYSKTRSFEEFVISVTNESSTSAALLGIIKYANSTTDQLISRYNKMLTNGEPFTPQILMEWRDYITSYDTLDDLQLLLSQNKNLLGDPIALDVLQKLIAKKKQIIQIYETSGKEVIARRLAPFYNEVKIRRKEELEAKFRVLEHRFKKDKSKLSPEELAIMDRGTTMEEYTEVALAKEATAIEKLTYETLLKELSVAANDVNEITRWVDNMQDSSDPVAAGMVAAFTKADEKSRLEALDQRIKVVNILRELEVYKGKTQFTSEKEFYKSILESEKESNELTGFLIRPWVSALDVEEKAIRKSNKNKTDKRAAEDTKAWIEANLPVDTHREDYLFSFNKFLEGLVSENKITKEEHTIIIDNEYLAGAPLTYLAKDETDEYGNVVTKALISEDAADLALIWKGRNKKLFADINEKWVNPQWSAFMKEVGVDTKLPIALQMEALEKSSHPMAKFYTLITSMANDGDSGLPYNYRLGYKLPGVSKNKNERLREGQSVSTMFKESMSIDFVRRADDITYQSREFTDEKGNPKYFLPIHYTAKLNADQQSYDLATIYFKFWESANDYSNKREILPTLEMAKYFVESRKTERRDSFGNRIMSVVRGNRPTTDSDVSVNNTSNLAAMLKDWFEVYVYGNTVKPSEIKVTDDLIVDGQKLVDGLNKYTSLNLLALNVVQGIANITIGEVMTNIDAMAGEYISLKSLTKASGYYSKWFPKMLGDIGSRAPEHVSSLLIEHFNMLNEDITQNMNLANLTKLKGALTMNSLGFIQQGGEHWMRARLLYAFLIEKRAIDKDGKDIGPMIDFYYSEGGVLKIKQEVNLINSKWTEEDVARFTRKIHGVATRLHGAYGAQERVAAQRYIIGKLAYMYRKFIIPGIRRRYGKNEYSERLQQTTEGNYVTTYKFFSRLLRDMQGYKLSLMSENWAALSPHEKANIKRTIGEIGTLITTIIIANFAYTQWGETDDDGDQRFWALMAYQAYRLKAEMLFYSPKLDESMSLLRSPMASMSVMENIIKLTSQMFDPTAVYERGPWKGHLKLERDAVQFIPIYKQYYKFRDIEEQIQWFR